MAGVPGYDPSRLFNQLLNTGLANKDQPLYQTLYLMIQQLVKLTAITSGAGGGSSIVNNNITQIIQQLDLDNNSGGDSSDISIPGPPGANGANGMVPYFIALGETFIVPLYKQALFAMNIDNEGILEIDGFLIEVNGGGGGTTVNNNTTVQLIDENHYSEED